MSTTTSITISNVQTKAINELSTCSFEFPSDSHIQCPVAPMATVKPSTEPNSLYVHCVVFLDEEFDGSSLSVEHSTPSGVNPAPGAVVATITYDYAKLTAYTKFKAWLVEFEIKNCENHSVEVYTTNTYTGVGQTDLPKTSRGTVTSVQNKLF